MPHETKMTAGEVRQIVSKLVALEVIKPEFWGVICFHIRDGRVQHVKIEQTLKLDGLGHKAES